MPDQPTKTSFCFVLMPTDPGLVNLWDAVIRPAIEQAGLLPLRGDDLATGGSIMLLRRHILQAAVVIAVISAKDPSVFVLYELGLAHATKKKVILLQEKGEQLPLALSSRHCVEYDPRNFPKSREALFKTLWTVFHAPEAEDLFPEFNIPSARMMAEYDYLKQTRKTLTVRVVPENCSIFLNNRYLGRSPQTVHVNPDVEKNVLSISALGHFEHYQEISETDLENGFVDVQMEWSNPANHPERVLSWLMRRRKDPNNPVLSITIADYFSDHGQYAQAWEEYLFCITQAPEWFRGYNGLGVLENAVGNFDKAKNHFQTVVELNRDDFIGWHNLACTESLRGDFDKAIDHLERILSSPVLAESWRQILCIFSDSRLISHSDFKNLLKSPQHQKKFLNLSNRFEKLRLSQPPALLPPPVQEEGKPQDLSFSLKSFRIKDFQCIKDTGMECLPADVPWIFITGDNGDGKTSLLQALAIGLNGSEDAEQRLKSNPAAKIGVEIREAGETVVRDFSRRDGHWFLADHQGGVMAPVAKLVTYGPARLDLSGESSRAGEVAERSPVYSLLQQRGNLRNIEHWLKMRALEHDDLINQRIQQVKQVLVTLMPNVSEMALVGSVFKYTEKGHVVESHNLSAGQYNILAMVGDLLIRLYESQPEVVEIKELCGIVLIDELDIHLHPIRQKELPGQLSAIFPNVQFIATTHSVIPVMGAPKGSVFLRVVRDALLGTRVDRPDIEIGNLLPNAVLTSPLFEMDSILPKQNKNPDAIHTDDDFADIQRKEKVDQALAQFAQRGNILPPGFLDPEE